MITAYPPIYMARIARVVVPNIPHHIVQRGNRKQRVFFSDEDRAFYLKTLTTEAHRENLSIWAYCLMDNHVHLIAVPKNEDSLAKVIGNTHKRYTRRVNFREGWRGYLWQGRFYSCPLDEPYLYAAVRYVERNPVRARIVAHPVDYHWSSARAHVSNSVDLVVSGVEKQVMNIDDWGAYLSDPEDDVSLRRLRMNFRTGRPLGSDSFIGRLESMTGRVLKRRKPGPKRHN